MQPTPSPNLRQLSRLQNQNLLLHQELQDLRTKYNNLKKQHLIWEQINKHNFGETDQTVEKSAGKKESQELDSLKEQFVAIIKEKQQQSQQILELKEKINDMKYTIQELRQLGEKQERIHQKQIQLLQMGKRKLEKQAISSYANCTSNSSINSSSSSGFGYTGGNSHSHKTGIVRQLQQKLQQALHQVDLLQEQLWRQIQANQKNQEKLEKCSEIAQEMEEYYQNEIDAKDQAIEKLQVELRKYTFGNFPTPNSTPTPTYQPSSPTPQRFPSHLQTSSNQDCSSLKCSSIVSQYQHLTTPNYEQVSAMEEKYERAMEEMRTHFVREVAMYQEKVGYLRLKVEALESEKAYFGRIWGDGWGNDGEGEGGERLGGGIGQGGSCSQVNVCNSSHKWTDTGVCASLTGISAHNQSKIQNPLHQSKTSTINPDSFSTSHNPKPSLHPTSHTQPNQTASRVKLTTVKTPNKSMLSKSSSNDGNGNNRNSCQYERMALGESNYCWQ